MLFCVPDGHRYRFVMEPLQVDLTARANEDKVETLTAAATARIESYVRRFPEAWLWIHDRWRTRPSEIPDAAEVAAPANDATGRGPGANRQ
jgi:KDO2-lipid IV(A) lauroyltransferase